MCAARAYAEPEWGGRSNEAYSLECIKDGSLVETIHLPKTKSCVILGRQPDVVDVPLDHPSISRQHAALQHKPNGELFVCDLESTHGTRVNKTRLQPRLHYRVRDGDHIVFGESTRHYIVCGGPPVTDEMLEQERAERREKRERDALGKIDVQRAAEAAKQRQMAAAAAASSSADGAADTGCSWGQADDAFDPDAEHDERAAPAPGARAGGAGGDDDGDAMSAEEAALLKRRTAFGGGNDDDDESGPTVVGAEGVKLRDVLPANVHDEEALLAEQMSRESEKQEFARYLESTQDDEWYFDRTTGASRKRAAAGATGGATTLAQLRQRLADNVLAQKALQRDIRAERDAVAAARPAARVAADDADDPLDAFMAGVAKKQEGERLTRLLAQQAELEREQRELEKRVWSATPLHERLSKSAPGAGVQVVREPAQPVSKPVAAVAQRAAPAPSVADGFKAPPPLPLAEQPAHRDEEGFKAPPPVESNSASPAAAVNGDDVGVPAQPAPKRVQTGASAAPVIGPARPGAAEQKRARAAAPAFTRRDRRDASDDGDDDVEDVTSIRL